jgi:hypothetical protein
MSAFLSYFTKKSMSSPKRLIGEVILEHPGMADGFSSAKGADKGLGIRLDGKTGAAQSHSVLSVSSVVKKLPA